MSQPDAPAPDSVQQPAPRGALPRSVAAAKNLQPRLAALGGALALGLAAIVFARAGEAAQALFTRLVTAQPL